MVFVFSVSLLSFVCSTSFPVYVVFYVLTVSGHARVSELLHITTRLCLCQQLFYSFFEFFQLLTGLRSGIRRLRRALLTSTVTIISPSPSPVNTFFDLFLKFLLYFFFSLLQRPPR